MCVYISIWTVQLDHNRQCYQVMVRQSLQVQLADKFHTSAEGCLVFGFALFSLPIKIMEKDKIRDTISHVITNPSKNSFNSIDIFAENRRK